MQYEALQAIVAGVAILDNTHTSHSELFFHARQDNTLF